MPRKADLIPFALSRVTCLIGPFGSGKTELSIGLALAAAAQPSRLTKVLLADLDVIKPYFRSRDALAALREQGVELIIPAGALAQSDLPLIAPEVRGAIGRDDVQVILDVGGDPVGARALGSLCDVVGRAPHDLLLVLNRHRPFMDAASGVIEYARQIAASARVDITGVLSNTHMLEETSADDVFYGLELAREVASALGVTVRAVGMPAALAKALEQPADLPPIIAIERHMKPDFLGGLVLASTPIRKLLQGETHASAAHRS